MCTRVVCARLEMVLTYTTAIDLRNKGNIAVDLRDNLEMLCQGSAYKTFLDRLVPILLKLLDGPPVFISSSPEQVRTPRDTC